MKKFFWGILGAALAANLCSAQELLLNCDSVNQVRSTFHKDNSRITFERGKGRTGNAFRITHPADPKNPKAKDIGFHAHGHYLIKLESISGTIRSRVYLKGKGKGTFGMLVFDRKRHLFYPPGFRKPFQLDSPDKWTLLEFTYTPEAGSDYAARAAFILPYISLMPGSDFLLDDWETKIPAENKNIVIEE